MKRVVPTAEFASFVYGRGVDRDDPAEAFHEASRLYPNMAPGRLTMLIELAASPELQQTAARSSRTNDHRPGVDLPRCGLPTGQFDAVVSRRRSTVASVQERLSVGDLSAILAATYRAEEVSPGVIRRPIPSGGALYPLELYAIPVAVDGLDRFVYHYHPFRHRLECLSSFVDADVRAALVDPRLADGVAVLLVVTAMFWRSRFKYGARGYRFALVEAGHAVQNAILAATALGLPTLPLGGFYDRRADELVGADGLDEATVYALLIGGRK